LAFTIASGSFWLVEKGSCSWLKVTSREPGAGSREPGAGSPQEGLSASAGKRWQALGSAR
jgi:hypothetical protein